MQKLAAIALLLAMLAVQLATARAQTTAFTYQGQLNDSGAIANGSYDISFAAYDAATAGNLIGGIVTNSAVTVSNGLFTTTVDFGSGVFTGGDLWLEIAVSTNGANAFATIAPRQPFTPAPYAIYAANSATATSIAANSITAAELFTIFPPVDGQVLSFTGGSLAWTDPAVAGGSVWSLNGSSAYYSAGGVGIGTASPISKFHVVSGASDLPPRLQSSGTSSFGSGWDFYHGAFAAGYVGVPDSVAGIAPGELLIFGGAGTPVSLWPGGLRALTLTPSGSVGVGTATPQAKLHIYDPAGSVTELIETEGGVNSWAQLQFKDADGQWNIGTSQSFNEDQLYFSRGGASVNAFAIQPNGNAQFANRLSVGTAGPAQYTLDVNGVARAGAGLAVTGSSSPNYPNTKGLYLEKGDYNTGDSYGSVYAFNYADPSPHAMTLALNSPGGYVGIGTTSPDATLEVNGNGHVSDRLLVGAPYFSVGDNFWTNDVDFAFGVGGAMLVSGASVFKGNVAVLGDLSAWGGFDNYSDRNAKENIAAVSADEILAKVVALPISKWNYKRSSGVRHIGPMAQDFYATFGTGKDDTHISTVDEEGVALAAIQGLNQKVNEKDARIQEQGAEIEVLKQSVAELKAPVEKLAAK